jgi:uridine kinase
MRRGELLERLADLISAARRPHAVRVAVDGVDAAGKTTLADELAGVLTARGRPVIRASADSFQNPRALRYRRGRDSPEGYFYDAFDLAALRERLLLPLGPGGGGRYRAAAFDLAADRALDPPALAAEAGAALLLDGVFLLRPELAPHFEISLFVEVAPETSLARGVSRDGALLGGEEAARSRYLARYLPGQRLYLASCDPRSRADAVIGNDAPGAPTLQLRAPAA